MSYAHPSVRMRRRGLVAVLAASAVALSLVLASPPVRGEAVQPLAGGATVSITSGSALWKLKDSWYGYIRGGHNQIIPEPTADGRSAFEPVAGTLNIDARAVDATIGGSVQYLKWFGPTTGPATIDVAFDNLRIDVAAGKGRIVADAVGNVDTVPDGAQKDIHLVDVTSAAFGTNAAGQTTVTLDGVFPAGVGERIIGFVLYEGQAMSPLTLTLDTAAAPDTVVTALQLSASPAGGATAGDEVTLRAEVTPAAAGTVRFLADGITLGESPVSGGIATFPTSSLPVGEPNLQAQFVPADSTAFTASDATITRYPVAPGEREVTETTLTVAAAGPVLLGSDASLSAQVKPATAEGTVRFFAKPETGGAERDLGAVPVANGVAALTTSTLVAGGHAVRAEFRGADAWTGNSSSATATIGIVDLSAGDIPVPGPDALPIAGATGSWDFSQYAKSRGFPFTALTGPLATVKGSWQLNEGVGEGDANVARIRFPGTIENNVWGFASKFSNPELTLTKDGRGYWTAELSTYCAAYPAGQFCTITPIEERPASVRTVLSTFHSVDGLSGPGTPNTLTVNFDFANVTATGTWASNQSAGFHNQFIWALEPMERGYYQTTGTAADPEKAPAPLRVSFNWVAKTPTELSVRVRNAAPVRVGDTVKVEATIVPSGATGSVSFFATSAVSGAERALGSATVSNGKATVEVADLASGGHQLRAEFVADTPATVAGSSGKLTEHFGIVDTSQPDAPQFTDSALTLTGATGSWEWSEYSTWNPLWLESGEGSISVSDQHYRFADGAGQAEGNVARISYPGILRMSSYGNYINQPYGSWLEIIDPTLTIDRDGSGSLSGRVRSSETVGWDAFEGPSHAVTLATFSGATGIPAAGESGTVDVALDFADSVATGSWAEGFASAWHGSFIAALPEGIQPFYFDSGLNIDGRKAPLPFSATFTWPTATVDPPVKPAAPSEADLRPELRGLITVPATAQVGETLTVGLGSQYSGPQNTVSPVTAYLFSTPTLLGGHAVAADGTIRVTLPAGVTGQHRLAVYAADGVIIGWDQLEIHDAAPAVVESSGQPLASTGAQGAVLTLSAAALLLLAGLVVMVGVRRRRQAD